MSGCREFSYLLYKDRQPLELFGKMKGKVSSKAYKNDNSELGISVRKNLVEKIVTNYKDWKSILPYQDKKKSKVQSIRTYNDKQNKDLKGPRTSGASYLINKSAKFNDNMYKQKKHLKEWQTHQKINFEKRHFCNSQSKIFQTNQLDICDNNPKYYTEALKVKIDKDIHSYYDRDEQNCIKNGKKTIQGNLFRPGNQLGYDQPYQKSISVNKFYQLAGTPQLLGSKIPLKRDDWRKSSISFS